MINWNAVTVGETKIGAPNSFVYLVIGMRNRAVWLEDTAGFHFTVAKESCVNWTIDDPWEEITEECEFISTTIGSVPTFEILYKGQIIRPHDPRWKVSKKLRVWKRKEG